MRWFVKRTMEIELKHRQLEILGKEAHEVKNLKLKLARIEKDLSQIDLAKRVGVTRQTIGMIEAGDYNPTLNLCIAICKELGKTLDDIFWEENENV